MTRATAERGLSPPQPRLRRSPLRGWKSKPGTSTATRRLLSSGRRAWCAWSPVGVRVGLEACCQLCHGVALSALWRPRVASPPPVNIVESLRPWLQTHLSSAGLPWTGFHDRLPARQSGLWSEPLGSDGQQGQLPERAHFILVDSPPRSLQRNIGPRRDSLGASCLRGQPFLRGAEVICRPEGSGTALVARGAVKEGRGITTLPRPPAHTRLSSEHPNRVSRSATATCAM